MYACIRSSSTSTSRSSIVIVIALIVVAAPPPIPVCGSRNYCCHGRKYRRHTATATSTIIAIPDHELVPYNKRIQNPPVRSRRFETGQNP
jgi:hypothetical protein